MSMDMDMYRQDLFDIFEGSSLDIYVNTPQQDRSYYMEKMKENINKGKSTKEKIDDVHDASLQVFDNLQKKCDDVTEKIAKRMVPSPQYRAWKDHRLIPNNVDYITYNQQMKRAKKILEKISPLFYTFLYITLPLTFEATGAIMAKSIIYDNVPLYSKFVKGELTEEEIRERHKEICTDMRKIHNEVGNIADKFENFNTGITMKAMHMLRRSEKEIDKATTKVETDPTKTSMSILASAIRAVCKKYESIWKSIKKEQEKDKSVETEIKVTIKNNDNEVKESTFYNEDMDIITRLKFAAFENVEDNNPYDLLNELVEQCDYDNDTEYEKLMDAYEYVLSL